MTDQDVAAITHLINFYGLVMDTQRWDLFDRIFTPDVDADYGDPACWTDLPAFKRDFEAFHAPLDATQHIMANHLVHVAGDTANAFTYGSWRLVRVGTDGGDLWEGTGWYDDELVRGRSGWLIKRRVCRVISWSGNPLVHETNPGVKFAIRSTRLRGEAHEGRIRYLNALTK